MDELANALEQLPNQLFITTDPALLDFTDLNRRASLVIMGGSVRIDLPLPKSDKTFKETLGLIAHYIGRKDVIIIGWNLKNFFSYIEGRKANLLLEAQIYDLKYLESYHGLENKCPASFDEAKQRLGILFKSGSWQQLNKIHRKIHIPLLKNVIPHLESFGINDLRQGGPVHAHYEIEGQANGRLLCSKGFSNGYSPHNMEDKDKESLKPVQYGKVFLYFDFKHMEASMVQWLSQDAGLGQILASGADLYRAIWEAITGQEGTDKAREFCKLLFLPVVYGQGIKSVSTRLNVSENTAKKLVNNIYRLFPSALSWAASRQTSIDAHGYAVDYFGRRRKFENEFYKIRNFCVQSPASIVCLSKLINVFNFLTNYKDFSDLAFHLHDGYGIMADIRSWRKISLLVKDVLETEDDLYPGLKLKVTCQMGEKLNAMNNVVF
jgi:hypothetical protein